MLHSSIFIHIIKIRDCWYITMHSSILQIQRLEIITKGWWEIVYDIRTRFFVLQARLLYHSLRSLHHLATFPCILEEVSFILLIWELIILADSYILLIAGDFQWPKMRISAEEWHENTRHWLEPDDQHLLYIATDETNRTWFGKWCVLLLLLFCLVVVCWTYILMILPYLS